MAVVASRHVNHVLYAGVEAIQLRAQLGNQNHGFFQLGNQNHGFFSRPNITITLYVYYYACSHSIVLELIPVRHLVSHDTSFPPT